MTVQLQAGMAMAAPGRGEVADVPTKPRSITYWTSAAGQDQIESFGGREDRAALSSWLSQTYPDLYGSDAGLDDLRGLNNRGVAAFVQVTEMVHGPDSVPSRTLAAALDEFSRTCALDQSPDTSRNHLIPMKRRPGSLNSPHWTRRTR